MKRLEFTARGLLRSTSMFNRLIGSLSMTLLLSASAYAQEPSPKGTGEPPGAHTHDGFFTRVGLDGGPVDVGESFSVGDMPAGPGVSWSGFTVGYDVLVGGTPARGLAVGGALLATTTKSPNVSKAEFRGNAEGTLIWSGIGPFADYYFDPHGGAHVQAMLGYSSVSFVSAFGDRTSKSPRGVFGAIGGGYDFWIANQWSVGPMARLVYAKMTSSSGGITDSVDYLYLSIGAGAVLH